MLEYRKGTAIKEDRDDDENPCSRMTHLLSMSLKEGFPSQANDSFKILEASGELSKAVKLIWVSCPQLKDTSVLREMLHIEV